MSNRDLHQVINNTMERKNQAPFQPEKSQNHEQQQVKPQFNNSQEKGKSGSDFRTSETQSVQKQQNKNGKSNADKRIKRAGLIMLGAFAVSAFMLSTLHSSKAVNVTDEAVQAMEQQVSTSLPLGTRLMSKDESLAGQDLTITHSSTADKTKIYIWDYAAEDGDYVQVLVDGNALGDPFMIKNKPVELEVPTTGEVQVLGTRDGGGGITYAIHYDLNGTTYFNGTSVGDGNLYTLIKE